MNSMHSLRALLLRLAYFLQALPRGILVKRVSTGLVCVARSHLHADKQGQRRKDLCPLLLVRERIDEPMSV